MEQHKTQVQKYPRVLVSSAHIFTIGLHLIFLFYCLFSVLCFVASVILKAFLRAIELSNVLSERESKKIKNNDAIANKIMVTA